MRILGFDLGERRVGAAVSDELGMFAHPLPTLEVTGDKVLAAEVKRLAAEHGAERLVIGLPLNNDGSTGPRAQRVLELSARLGRETGLPVEHVDERFTSREAERYLAAAPKKVRKQKGNLDAASAVIILQAYLDART